MQRIKGCAALISASSHLQWFDQVSERSVLYVDNSNHLFLTKTHLSGRVCRKISESSTPQTATRESVMLLAGLLTLMHAVYKQTEVCGFQPAMLS